eukprot:scaffold13278_cov70-Isochrysis_galbana.AAC.2
MCIHVLMPGGSACFNDARAEVLRPYPTRTNVQVRSPPHCPPVPMPNPRFHQPSGPHPSAPP